MGTSSWEKILANTAKTESRGDYGAVARDDAGTGLAYGIVQFNQTMGSLADLFKAMRQASPAQFDSIFGSYAANMTNTAWVKSTVLSTDDFVARLKAAGVVPAFQAAQRDTAKRLYFDPIVSAVATAGLTSERAYAMAFDTAIQRGVGNAKKFLAAARTSASQTEAEVLQKFASLADDTTRVGTVTRRMKMLTDAVLSDGPLMAAAAVGTGFLVLLGISLAAWYANRS